jgi:hypothetical protein
LHSRAGMPLAFPRPADRSKLAVRAEAFGTTADSWEGDNRHVSVCPGTMMAPKTAPTRLATPVIDAVEPYVTR